MRRKEYQKNNVMQKVMTRACALAMVGGMILSPVGELHVLAADYPYRVMTSQALQKSIPELANATTINVGNIRGSHVTVVNNTAYYNITEDGTYRLTGSNKINGVYVETQIVVAKGVHATLFLDDLQIKNQKGQGIPLPTTSITKEEGTAPLLVEGTADLYVTNASTVETAYCSKGCIAIRKSGSLTMNAKEGAEALLSVRADQYCPGIGTDGDFIMKDGNLSINAKIGIGTWGTEAAYGNITIEGGSVHINLTGNDTEEVTGDAYIGIDCEGYLSEKCTLSISGGSVTIEGNKNNYNTGIYINDGNACTISGGKIIFGSADQKLKSGIKVWDTPTVISGGQFICYTNGLGIAVGSQGKVTGGNYLLDPWNLNRLDDNKNIKGYHGSLDVTTPAKILSVSAIPADINASPIPYNVKDTMTGDNGDFCFIKDISDNIQAFYVTFQTETGAVTKKYEVGEEISSNTQIYALTEQTASTESYKVTIHDLDTGTEEEIYTIDGGRVVYPDPDTKTAYIEYFKDEEMTQEAPDIVSGDTKIFAKRQELGQVEVKDYNTGESVDTIRTDRSGNYTLPDSKDGYKIYEYYKSKEGEQEDRLTGSQNINENSVVYLKAVKNSYTVTFQDPEGKILEQKESCEYGAAESYSAEEAGYQYFYESTDYFAYSEYDLGFVNQDMTFTVYSFKKHKAADGRSYVQIDSKEDFINLSKVDINDNYFAGYNVYLNSDLELNLSEYSGCLYIVNYSIFEGNGHTITLTQDSTDYFNGFIQSTDGTTFQNLKLDITIKGKMSTRYYPRGCFIGYGYENTYRNCTLRGTVTSSDGMICYEAKAGGGKTSFINCTLEGKSDVPTALICQGGCFGSPSVEIENCYVSSAQESNNAVFSVNNPWYLCNNSYSTYLIKNNYYSPLGYDPTYDDSKETHSNNQVISTKKEAAGAIINTKVQNIYGVTGTNNNDVRLELLSFNEDAGRVHKVTYYDADNNRQVFAGVAGDEMTSEEKSTLSSTYYYNPNGTKTEFTPSTYTFGENIVLYEDGQNVEPQLKSGVSKDLTTLLDFECTFDLSTFLQEAPEGYSYEYSFANDAGTTYCNVTDKYTIENGSTLKVLKKREFIDNVDVIVSLEKDDKTLEQVTIPLQVTGVDDNTVPVIKNGKTTLNTDASGYTYCGGQTFSIEDDYLDTVTLDGKNVSLTDGNQLDIQVEDGKTTTGLIPLTATDRSGNSITVYVCVNKDHTWKEAPVFTWTGDKSKASAVFTCSICGEKKQVEAKVTSEITKPASYTEDGEKTYIAKIILGDKTYTDTKTEIIPKLTLSKDVIYVVKQMKYKVTSEAASGTGTVTLIGSVENKSKLTSLIIGDTVKIGEKTFKITAIGDNAYKGYKKLKKVTIGKNMKVIGTNAFYNCKNLSKIKINSKGLTGVKKKAIKNIKKNARIYVPKGKANRYKKLFKSSTGYKKSMKLQ